MRANVKADIKKGLTGYIFLLVLSHACIVTGISAFSNNVPSAIFCVAIGLALLGVGVSMVLRKN